MSTEWVLDTSVLIQNFIKDRESLRVKTLINHLSDTYPSKIHIPDSCLVECGNVLWQQVRFHGIPSEVAKAAFNNLLKMPLTVHISRSLLPRALELALDHTLAVYDTLYLALAEKLNLPLITVDARQMQIAQNAGIKIKPVTDFVEKKDK